ncbi:MAG: vWA domain-containing protein [Myxococcota bacterium]
MKSATCHRPSSWLAALLLVLGACGDDGGGGSGEGTGINLPTGGGAQSLDGSTGATGGSSDDDGPSPPGCGASMFTLEHQPTNVVLVLDKSFSMVDNLWDSDDNPMTPLETRWSSLHRSVSFIIDEFDNGLNFGAVLFPSVDVPDNEWQTACLVSLEPDAPVAPNNGEQVLASLPGPNELELFGGTPTSEGVSTALNHLRSLDPGLPRAMILITDGAANCLAGTSDDAVFNLYDTNLPGLVAEAYNEEEIPTYVVGIDIIDGIANFPQDNPFERLNEVAIAGGFPQPGVEKFHNAQNEEELRSAISQITSQIGCIIPLDMAPVQPDLLSIFIDEMEIPFVASCEDDEQGWNYVNPDGPYDEIELCAQACDLLHNTGSLAAHYNCIPQG